LAPQVNYCQNIGTIDELSTDCRQLKYTFKHIISNKHNKLYLFTYNHAS